MRFPIKLSLCFMSLAMSVGCSNRDVAPSGTDAGTTDSGSHDMYLAADEGIDSSMDAASGDTGVADMTVSSDANADASTDFGVDASRDAGADAGVDMGLVTGACAGFEDDALRSIVYDGPKVPSGFYYEPDVDTVVLGWMEPCSPDADATHMRAIDIYTADAIVGYDEAPQFFQVNIMNPGMTFTIFYRTTRCEYFDGTTLAGAPHTAPDALASFVGYQWFTRYLSLDGAKIVNGVGACTGDRCTYDLCHVRTTYGDFGLCDEIEYFQTHYTITLDGVVSEDPERRLKRIDGMCHPT